TCALPISRSDKRDIYQCPGQAGHHHPGMEEGAAARSPQFIRRPFPMEEHLPKIAPVPGKDRPELTAGILQVNWSRYHRSNTPFKFRDCDIPCRSGYLFDTHCKGTTGCDPK